MRFVRDSRLLNIILALSVCAAILLGVVYFVRKFDLQESVDSVRTTSQDIVSAIVADPTPFPFQEMTIPYLRNREFRSALGELQEVSDNANYTSYTTSYDSEGFKINGLLTIPKGEEPAGGWPAVVFVHGYIPPANYRTTSNYVSYVDYLAKNGLVVFKIDLRGHGSSEGESSGGYYSGGYVLDTLNAHAALAGAGFVNKDAIGLWGHSMAGNITMRAFAAKPEIKGIVVWAGAGFTYTDLQEYRIDDNSYRPPAPDSEATRRRQELRETYGEFDPNDPFWRQVPATNYLNEVKGAVELHHAVDDNVVSIDYSRNLVKVLTKAGIPNELFEYQSGGHNLTGSSFTQAMQRSVEFYKERLK